MTLARVTVWSDKGATKAYDDPRTRRFLDATRPQIITLHSDPRLLASDGGGALTQRVRRDYPDARVWWGVQGDSHGPDPQRAWVTCAVAAEALDVECVELNCETGWRRAKRPQGYVIARRALLAMRAAAPHVVLGHTAFDGPVNFVHRRIGPIKLRWGYGGDYPWRGFLGEATPVDWTAPQVYAAPRIGSASRASILARLDKHQRSWRLALTQGLVSARVARHIYLQSHHTDTSGLVTAAESAEVAAFWCAPNRIDDAGRRAVAAVSLLHRGGMTVREFQGLNGLTVDGVCGPRTLAALGVA